MVAIKELRDVSEGSPAWHRARRELEALLRLKGHPYVVSVEEIIDGPNGPCLVMEYAPGGSLMKRLSSGPMAPPEVIMVGQHVTQALVAAHEVGIVHRDVKPHNLLVGAFGQVKVCDFGISAVIRGADARTQTHSLTLAYASPEELDGEAAIGPPADVYSFAATMLHLISGHRPTFRERMSGATSDISMPGGADPFLRPVLHALRTSLAHDPADRPTMDDLRIVFDNAAVALGSARIHQLSPLAVPVETPTLAMPLLPDGLQLITTADIPTNSDPDGDAIDRTRARSRQEDLSKTVIRSRDTSPAGAVGLPSAGADSNGDETAAAIPATALGELHPKPTNPRRPVVLIGVAALVILIAGVLIVTLTRGGGKKVSAAADATYTFSPLSYPGGVVMTRQWDLSGSGSDDLTSTLVFTNSGSSNATGDFFEVIPKSVATDAGTISFTPSPAEIVQADPVVRYHLAALAPGKSVTLAYRVKLTDEPSPMQRLKRLAADQVAAELEFSKTVPGGISAVSLASLTIAAVPALQLASVTQLQLTGAMSDSSNAPSAVLAGVNWSSSAATVASVDKAGLLTALAAGSATIAASAGAVTATVQITVVDTATTVDPSLTTLVVVAEPTVTVRPVPNPGQTTPPATTKPVSTPTVTTPPTAPPKATTPPTVPPTVPATAPPTVPPTIPPTVPPTTVPPVQTPPGGHVSLSEGAPYGGTVGGCVPGLCHYLYIVLSGYPPNSSVALSCLTGAGPFYSWNAAVDSTGGRVFANMCWYDGHSEGNAYVTANGIPSNSVGW